MAAATRESSRNRGVKRTSMRRRLQRNRLRGEPDNSVASASTDAARAIGAGCKHLSEQLLNFGTNLRRHQAFIRHLFSTIFTNRVWTHIVTSCKTLTHPLILHTQFR